MVSQIEAILDEVEHQPEQYTRSIAHIQGVSHIAEWRVFREEKLHPYHLQRVQALNEMDLL